MLLSKRILPIIDGGIAPEILQPDRPRRAAITG
jgi:hypothetical protein